MWRWFEVGHPSDPLLVLLHGVCGSAVNFFQQLSALQNKGLHVVSLQWPAFSSLSSFLTGFDAFLSQLHAQQHTKAASSRKKTSNTREIHLMGAELGGLLALHYAAMRPHLVKSVILCNAFISTDPLWEAGASLRTMMSVFFGMLPHTALRKIVISQFLRPLKPLRCTVAASAESASSGDDSDDDLQAAFRSCQPPRSRSRDLSRGLSRSDADRADAMAATGGSVDSGVILRPQESLEVRNSKEFLIAHLDAVSTADLAARLSLHSSIEPAPFVPQLNAGDNRLLILHTLDSGLPPQTEEGIVALYPCAKLATMRNGGPFPFLAAAEEVSMHIELHMRRCGAIKLPSAKEHAAHQEQERKSRGLDSLHHAAPRSSQDLPCVSPWQDGFPSSLPNYPSSCTTITCSGSSQYQPWSLVTHHDSCSEEPAYSEASEQGKKQACGNAPNGAAPAARAAQKAAEVAATCRALSAVSGSASGQSGTHSMLGNPSGLAATPSNRNNPAGENNHCPVC
ncbi:maspardin [Cyclospora cayetanensis]|uniref:Maspardin n=1 Tax=Cyclospora cayetanensis TaxID=88456 RepID=A0A6P6S0L0_9EIME|nr:maspardin [Cyclospora cayetanensis]